MKKNSKTSELEAKVAALEQRVAELERRPVYVPQPYPVPQYVDPWPWITPPYNPYQPVWIGDGPTCTGTSAIPGAVTTYTIGERN